MKRLICIFLTFSFAMPAFANNRIDDAVAIVGTAKQGITLSIAQAVGSLICTTDNEQARQLAVKKLDDACQQATSVQARLNGTTVKLLDDISSVYETVSVRLEDVQGEIQTANDLTFDQRLNLADRLCLVQQIHNTLWHILRGNTHALERLIAYAKKTHDIPLQDIFEDIAGRVAPSNIADAMTGVASKINNTVSYLDSEINIRGGGAKMFFDHPKKTIAAVTALEYCLYVPGLNWLLTRNSAIKKINDRLWTGNPQSAELRKHYAEIQKLHPQDKYLVTYVIDAVADQNSYTRKAYGAVRNMLVSTSFGWRHAANQVRKVVGPYYSDLELRDQLLKAADAQQLPEDVSAWFQNHLIPALEKMVVADDISGMLAEKYKDVRAPIATWKKVTAATAVTGLLGGALIAKWYKSR